MNEAIRVAQVEQILSGKQNVISHELAISIPLEVRDLSFDKILLFQRWVRPFKRNRYTRLLGRFSTLGAINGYTKSDLYREPGIGRTSIKTLLQWLKYFHTGPLRSLVDRLTTQRNYSISSILCSLELLSFFSEHSIQTIDEIKVLDSMDFTEAKDLDKISLLELRTLNIHPGTGKLMTGINFASSSQTIIEAVDYFLENDVKSKRRDILLPRWGPAEKITTFQEIGRMHHLTRERVRQVIEQEIECFRKYYISNEDNILLSFYEEVMSNLRPISFSNLNPGEKYRPLYSQYFYLGFLSEVFETVPFEGYLPSCKTYSPTAVDVRLLASEPDLIELRQLFMQMSHEEKLAYLKVIISSECLILSQQGNRVYVNRTNYGLIPLLRQCVKINDGPTSLEEFYSFLEDHPLYLREVNRRSLYSTLNRIPEFVTIDYHVWGLERHVSYPEKDWPAIQKAVRHILGHGDQQINASVSYDLVRKNFPMLRSKYELLHILRNDPHIKYLGFFNLALKESD